MFCFAVEAKHEDFTERGNVNSKDNTGLYVHFNETTTDMNQPNANSKTVTFGITNTQAYNEQDHGKMTANAASNHLFTKGKSNHQFTSGKTSMLFCTKVTMFALILSISLCITT